MNAKSQKEKSGQRGNALVYVLIAIALFAALSFTLSRQTDTGEAGALSEEKAELYAVQLINYAAQAKSSVDQMLFSGADVDDLDFTRPGETGFGAAPTIYKIYHPDGGGLSPGRLPSEAVSQSGSDPVPGWYMGRFNNVEWTETAADDVILTAYQISKPVCEKINMKITGAVSIPVMGDSIRNTMIDDSVHGGTNIDLTTDPSGSPVCAECDGKASLCVQNQAQTAYGFYTVVADQ